ncbi:MAG TPA: 1-acyl-sn-glycerol-3-phosphate acyltransferase [Gammaproteobacteria bacterium]|nr:1-acyl-sn-glycerol-3-phosphate acyltransferase [Gammaproteobacteria bacterium]
MILALGRFIRVLIGWIDLIVLTVFLYLLSWLPKPLPRSFNRSLFHYWCKVFVDAFGAELRIHENYLHPLPKQFILISNHPSAFEDIGMPALFKVRFLAKIEVKKWWIVGRISQFGDTLYVKRESKDSRNEATETILKALAKGDSIGLYPEGGCKGRRIHLPFLHGTFDIAIQSKVPLVPVFLHYEAQEAFEWQDQHLLQKMWEIFRAKNPRANYYIFDAINPTDFENKEALSLHVQNLYLKWQEKYLI